MLYKFLLCVTFVTGVLSVGCFHGSGIVQTAEFGPITIEELAKHSVARVLTTSRDDTFIFSPIKYWLHANPTEKYDYLEISINGSSLALSVTPDHLMYTMENETTDHHFRKVVQAREIKIGDFVIVHTAQEPNMRSMRVLRIDATQKMGIFAPVTVEGSILVNNVLASSYAVFKNEYIQAFFLDALFHCRHVLELILPKHWILPTFMGVQADVPEAVLQLLNLAQSLWS